MVSALNPLANNYPALDYTIITERSASIHYNRAAVGDIQPFSKSIMGDLDQYPVSESPHTDLVKPRDNFGDYPGPGVPIIFTPSHIINIQHIIPSLPPARDDMHRERWFLVSHDVRPEILP